MQDKPVTTFKTLCITNPESNNPVDNSQAYSSSSDEDSSGPQASRFQITLKNKLKTLNLIGLNHDIFNF